MSNQDAPPDLELLHDVELEMVRVSTAIDELSRDDADPEAVVSWVPHTTPDVPSGAPDTPLTTAPSISAPPA